MDDTYQTLGLQRGLTNYGDRGFARYLRMSFARSMGYSADMLSRPIVGIAGTYIASSTIATVWSPNLWRQ